MRSVDAFTSRLVGTAVLVGINLVLARVLPLTRKELRSALMVAAILGALDVLVEGVLGALGVWRYHLSLSIAGVPVDLFVDFFLIMLALCMGYAALGHVRAAGAMRAAYLLATTLVVGSWAIVHNRSAVEEGMITFAPGVDVDTPWFIAGNYLTIAAAIGGLALAYRYLSSRSSPAASA